MRLHANRNDFTPAKAIKHYQAVKLQITLLLWRQYGEEELKLMSDYFAIQDSNKKVASQWQASRFDHFCSGKLRWKQVVTFGLVGCGGSRVNNSKCPSCSMAVYAGKRERAKPCERRARSLSHAMSATKNGAEAWFRWASGSV